jgi:hypothetical protein
MKGIFCLAFVFTLLVCAASVASCAAAEWTIMVYMSADCELDKFAINDMNLMEDASFSSQKVNVVVQIDRNEFAPWQTCRRYKIQHDNDLKNLGSTLLEEMGEINMGVPATLRKFVLWAINNYPAKKYCLVIYGHGSGYQGFCRDLTDEPTGYQQKIRLDQDLSMEMQEIKNQMGKKIDLILFHSCVMGMWEVVQFFQDYAEYCTVSEDDITQIEYTTFLNQLNANPSADALTFGSFIVNSNMKENTLSLVDLSQLGPVTNSVNRFALALSQGKSEGYDKQIEGAFNNTIQFSDVTKYSYYIDLQDFARHVRGDVSLPHYLRIAAQDVDNAVTTTVKVKRNSAKLKDAGGISIYHCKFDGSDYDAKDYSSLGLTGRLFWADYLEGKKVPNYELTVPRFTHWEEAAKPTGLSGDNACVCLNLPFTFNFYGPDYLVGHSSLCGMYYKKVSVCTNGFLSFDGQFTISTPSILPDMTDPNGMIAGLWRDLVVDSKASVTYESSNEKFVVSWNNVRNHQNNNRQSFQIVLYPDGEIMIQYKALTNDAPSAIGIENRSGTLGISCGRPDDYLSGSIPRIVTLLFTPPETWF